MNLFSAAPLVATLLFAGGPFCSFSPVPLPPTTASLNVLNINEGQISAADRTAMAATLDRWATDRDPDETIVVHFHGGLVDSNSALIQARTMEQFYAGPHRKTFYFIYNTGPAESVIRGDNERALFSLHDNAGDAVLNRIIFPVRNLHRRQNDGDDHGGVTYLEERLRGGLPPTSFLGKTATFAWAYMKQTVRDGVDLTDYSASAPTRTGEHLTPQEECAVADGDQALGAREDRSARLLRSRYNPSLAGGRAFLCDLLRVVETRAAARERTHLVLVGHSTGSIYITQLLRKANYLWHGRAPGVKFDVVFLAPAVTYRLFAQMIDETQFERLGNFHVFTMDDEHERDDFLLSAFQPSPALDRPLANVFNSSILYLISGVLEPGTNEPLVGMARFVHPLPPYVASSENYRFVRAVQQAIAQHAGHAGQTDSLFTYAPTAISASPPYASCAVDHTNFTGDKATGASLAALLSLSDRGLAWPY